MTIRIVLSALLIFLGSSVAKGSKPNAFFFTCDFMEKYQDSAWQVVDSRSFAAPLEADFQFSMGNFSYRLRPDSLSSKAVKLESQVNCFDTSWRNFFDQKVVTKGASVFFDSALVRGSSVYRIRLTFDSLANSNSECSYKYGDSSFVSDPSGKYEIFYIKKSLGDVRWNQIRDALERDYKNIAPIYELKDQSRINYFISPCRVADVGWDPRWENAIDLSRNNVFTQYSTNVNQIYMDIVMMLRFLRNWGYSPSLLLEGAACAPDFCDLYAKEDLQSHKLPSLATVGVSKKYRALDRTRSSAMAGSFANYLLRTQGLTKYRDFYQRCTDLTLAQTFQQVFGRPLSDVESEWHGYLDTLTFKASAYLYHIERAQVFMRVDEMKQLGEEGLAATHDTTRFGPTLSGIYYSLGDYSRAAAFFRYQMQHDTSSHSSGVFLANMLLADGKIAAAESLYLRVAETDTSDTYASQKLALIDLHHKKPAASIELLQKAGRKNTIPANGIDIDLALGDAYSVSGQTDSARVHYQLALDHSKILISSASDNPMHYLRAGRAALRLDSPKVAQDYLQTAFFLEERMFYLGQILLALGQTNDVLGDRKTALENYHKVLKFPTAYLDRQEAEKYLQSAYHN